MPGVFASVSLRLRQWLLSRRKPVDSWTLTQRNIYIVPTRAGLAFCLTVLLLLIASINYQLNLGYALTFLLAGSALASMHMTHASLRGLTLHVRPPAPAFAGDDAALEIIVTNPGAARHGVGLAIEPADQNPPAFAWADITAQGQSSVHVAISTSRRGRHALPALRAESRFPFGLFRAWSVWLPAGQVWVWPAQETPPPPLPEAEPVAGNQRSRNEQNRSEFDGVRAWRRGDSLRQVVWKKVAHTGEMVSRDSTEGAGHHLWLSWAQTRQTDTEGRLSRLCSWVLQAEAKELAWGLRLPGQALEVGHGSAHRDAALQVLAEWD